MGCTCIPRFIQARFNPLIFLVQNFHTDPLPAPKYAAVQAIGHADTALKSCLLSRLREYRQLTSLCKKSETRHFYPHSNF
jgi:hypothetical protein